MELPRDVKYQLGKMEEVMSELESLLKPFSSKFEQDSKAQLTALQRAEVHLSLAQSVSALFNLFLKARGVDPEEHDSNKEEERLRQYSRKVRKALAEQELSKSKRALEVDVAAMSRFIAAAVPDLSAEQKKGLKAAGGKDKEKRQREMQERKSDKKSEKKRRKSGDVGSRSSHQKDAALAFIEETLAEVRSSKGSGNKSVKK